MTASNLAYLDRDRKLLADLAHNGRPELVKGVAAFVRHARRLASDPEYAAVIAAELGDAIATRNARCWDETIRERIKRINDAGTEAASEDPNA